LSQLQFFQESSGREKKQLTHLHDDRLCCLNYSSHNNFLEFCDRQKIARQLPNEGLRVSGEWTLGIEVHDATGRLFLTLIRSQRPCATVSIC
jgi:hypothetical protein